MTDAQYLTGSPSVAGCLGSLVHSPGLPIMSEKAIELYFQSDRFQSLIQRTVILVLELV